MGIRFIILAGMVGAASLAQAGPVQFGGMGVAKSTFAIGTVGKVGDFGRSGDAPAATLPAPASTRSSPSPLASSGLQFVSPEHTPAPFLAGSGFNVGPADPSSLGNGGVTGGPSSPPPLASIDPPSAPREQAVPVTPDANVDQALPVRAPGAAPVAEQAAPPETPVRQTPIADVGNSEEVLAGLIPAAGVAEQDKLQLVLAPLAEADATAIPEPSSGFLMLAGLFGAGALTRRRRN